MKDIIKVAIIDDDKDTCLILKGMLERFCEEKEILVSIEIFLNPALFLKSFINQFTLIFLDIEMPEVNGIDVAKEIRKTDNDVYLAFVTNLRHYAIYGYEVDASDFIVKPIAYSDFSIKLSKIVKKISTSPKTKLSIKFGSNISIVDLVETRYVEVGSNHKVLFHTLTKTYETKGTLKEFQDVLETNRFIKVNNYMFVNPKFVVGLDGFSLTLEGNEKNKEINIFVSRSRKKEVIVALNRYFGDYL